jgi:hypothetical protein
MTAYWRGYPDMKRLLTFFCLLLPLAAPAQAGPLSIVDIGNNSAATGSATLAVTTTAACPAGNAVAVFTGVIANVGINAVTDSAGSTYSQGTSITLSGSVARQRLQFANARNNGGLPIGSTITANYAATTGIKLAAAACISGAMSVGNPADVEATPTTGTGTSPSLPITNPPLSPAEIDICAYLVASGAGDTFTNTSGFSPLARVNNSAALDWEYKITSDFSQQTCAPTLGTSRTWGVNGRGFLQTQGVRALTGVGQ